MEDLIGSLTSTELQQQSEQLQGDEEELHEHIWGRLPEELVDRVLARLPVPLLLQLRTVSRRWKSLITSPLFSKQQVAALAAKTSVGPPHFLVFGCHSPGPLQVYNPTCNRWYKSPLADTLGDDAIVLSVASDGGLLCIVRRSGWSESAGPTRILVCNPVYPQCMRELPLAWACSQTPVWIPRLVVLIVDQEKNSFKVVAVGALEVENSIYKPRPHLCRATEVYDSESDSWERTGDLPRFSEDPLGFWLEFEIPSFVFCRGHIYCIAKFHQLSKLFSYDLERKVWNIVPLQMPNLRWFHSNQVLVERWGQLVLVKQTKMISGAGKYVVPEMFTWRPGSGSGEWTPVEASVPIVISAIEEHFQQRIINYDFRRRIRTQYIQTGLKMGGAGDLVLISTLMWDRAVLYNMSRMSSTVTPMNELLRLTHYVRMIVPFHFSLQMLSSG